MLYVKCMLLFVYFIFLMLLWQESILLLKSYVVLICFVIFKLFRFILAVSRRPILTLCLDIFVIVIDFLKLWYVHANGELLKKNFNFLFLMDDYISCRVQGKTINM